MASNVRPKKAMRIYIITIAAALCVTCGSILSAPLPRIPATSVEGKIRAFVWMDGFRYEEADVYGIVNPVGINKIPSRYFLLIDAPKLDKKVAKQISSYAYRTTFTTKLHYGSHEEGKVLVVLNCPRREEFKVGATIKIEGYELGGDEFDVWPKCVSISINGNVVPDNPKDRIVNSGEKKPGEQDGADQPATAPESKTKSKKEPQPGSEVRPQ